MVNPRERGLGSEKSLQRWKDEEGRRDNVRDLSRKACTTEIVYTLAAAGQSKKSAIFLIYLPMNFLSNFPTHSVWDFLNYVPVSGPVRLM